MAIPRKDAEAQAQEFQAFYDKLSPESQANYGSGHTITRHMRQYEHCHSCGGTYKNFRPAVDGDCPDGCTIGGIIHYDD